MRPAFGPIGGLFNRPLLLESGSRDRAFGLLADWAAAARPGSSAYGGFEGDDRADYKPYEVVCGVAVIPIRGVLVQRTSWCSPWLSEMLGIQGYDAIRLMFLQALADESVDAIVLAVDSPGGDVAGCFDLVDTIYAARGVKPIWAILDENAYSAAYALASSADPGRIYVPRTGGTGSVGVICIHVSVAGMLEKLGVEPTAVFAGDHKADFSDLTALSDEARARIQADVDATAAIFAATVARNRGLEAAAVTATQALTYQGKRGVDVGFADVCMAPDAAFRALLAELG